MLRRLDRGLLRRLGRIAAIVGARQAVFDQAQEEREARRFAAAVIRAGLEHNGIDPATVPAVQRLEAVDREPPPISARPLQSPLAAFCDEMRALARRCREDPIDLATATPIMLFALFGFGEEEAAPA
jgi:hypothetical protein